MRTTQRTVLTRALTAVAVAALGATMFGFGASPAAAESYDGAVQLSWDGTSYAATTTLSYFGAPVSIPGDTAKRTLQVRNDGPTDGYLTARIVNVDLRTPEAADVHHQVTHTAPDRSGLYADAGFQGNMYDDILVDWVTDSASLSALDRNGSTQLMRVPIAQGEVVPIAITYRYPISATSGNNANVDPREASFDLEIEIGGDDSTPNLRSSPPALTHTGGNDGWPILTAGFMLVVAGAVVLQVRRRGRFESLRHKRRVPDFDT